MDEFAPDASRDATAVIAGFVYQIDTTIERWLSLRDGSHLEIERAEDVDIVSRDSLGLLRVAEQVKRRKKPITLRSAQVLAALARFFETIRANPGQRIFFRYVTTAPIGREAPPLKAIGPRPALEHWEQLRANNFGDSNANAACRSIGDTIKNHARPGVPKKLWEDFCRYLKVDENLRHLIRSVEWRGQETGQAQLRERIKASLVTLKLSKNLSEAHEHYQMLFFFIIDLICGSSRRSLHPEDLQAALDGSRKKEAQSLFEQLESRLAKVEEKVERHERKLAQQEQVLGLLLAGAGIDQGEQRTVGATEAEAVGLSEEHALAAERAVVRISGVSTGGATSVAPPSVDLDVPPLVQRAASRRAFVRLMVDSLAAHVCLWLRASSGMGKSQCAILASNVLRSQRGDCVWISLRGTTTAEITDRIILGLAQWAGIPREASIERFLAKVFSGGRRAVIVLDDVPALIGEEAVVDRFATLIDGAGRGPSSIGLIITSTHEPPRRLFERVDEGRMAVLEAPPFDNDDVDELLAANQAPDSWRQPTLRGLLLSVTHGHPTLLAAAIQYLSTKGWTLDEDVLRELLAKEFSAEASQESLVKIAASMHAHTAQLLYRLGLPFRSFDRETISLLGDIDPSIDNVPRRTGELIGPWLQRERDNRFTLSPLLESVAASSVPAPTRKAGHLALGRQILTRPSINSLNVGDCVRHFVQGDNQELAAQVLIWALALTSRADQEEDCRWLLQGPATTLDEQTLSTGTRLLLTASRIRAAKQSGLSYKAEMQALKDMLGLVDSSMGFHVAGAFVHVGQLLSSEDFELSIELLRLAVLHLPNATMPSSRGRDRTDLLNSVDRSLWDLAGSVDRPDRLKAWSRVLSSMVADQRAAAVGDATEYEHGVLVISDALWVRAHEAQATIETWRNVEAALAEFAASARAMDLELLWAAAVRARGTVVAEYLHEVERALSLLSEAIASAQDSRSKFLLEDAAGRQCLYAGRKPDAKAWLLRALEEQTTAFPLQRIVAHLSASQALAIEDQSAAVRQAEAAVALAERAISAGLPKSELSRARGELAIAVWRAKGIKAAVPLLSLALREHLAFRETFPRRQLDWINIVVLLGKVAGCLEALARLGEVPQDVSGERFALPEPGWFTKSYPGDSLKRDYQYDHELLAPHVMTRLASAVGESALALEWGQSGLAQLRETNRGMMLLTLAHAVIPELILANRITQALELALETTPFGIAGMIRVPGDLSPGIFRMQIDPSVVLGSKPSTGWSMVEQRVALQVFMTAAWQLARIALKNPKEGHSHANDLARACMRQHRSASLRQLWSAAADFFSSAFAGSTTAGELRERARSYSGELQSLRMAAYVAASLKETSINDVLSMQAVALGGVEGLPDHSSTIVAAAFLDEFWTPVRDGRLLMLEVQSELNTAREGPSEPRARNFLRIIARVLGVQLPTE